MSTMEDPSPPPPELALLLSGGGARAAYQVGLLRFLGRLAPDLRVPIICGVSAGAINAAFLAAHPGTLAEAADDLTHVWEGITFDNVFRVDASFLMRNAFRWLIRLATGGSGLAPKVRGLVDTSPLRELLEKTLDAPGGVPIPGIVDNLTAGRCRALALVTLNYGTGQTVTWVDGADIQAWERPNRRSRRARLTVEHVMASASLPLLFPAVQLDGAWYGDGGIRLAAPLSPSLHLGSGRVLAVSTRYPRTLTEADEPAHQGYPPPAQIFGNLMNAIFLDVLDRDVRRLERLNSLLRQLPPEARHDLYPIDLLLLRPSQDLGLLAANYEPQLPKVFRFLTRGLGTRETKSPDALSLLMFQPDYLRKLIAIGEQDAEAHQDELLAFLAGKGTSAQILDL